jgi:hypothetical protein
LDQPYFIDHNVLHIIFGFPIFDEDPMDSLIVKDAAQEEVYSRFGTHRGKQGVVIPEINNPSIWFATLLFYCKIICKCHKEECIIRVVLIMARCVQGLQMAWAPYFLNEFIINFFDVQYRGK